MEPSVKNLTIVIARTKPVKVIVAKSPLLRYFLNPETFIRNSLLRNLSIETLTGRPLEVKIKLPLPDIRRPT